MNPFPRQGPLDPRFYVPLLLSSDQRDLLWAIAPEHTPLSTPRQRDVSGESSVSPGQVSRSVSSSGGDVDVRAAYYSEDPRTTVMLKRISRRLTRPDLWQVLQRVKGLENSFDFIHIPWDNSRQSSRGFGFVNFIDPVHVGILADALNTGVVPEELRGVSVKYARQQGDRDWLTRFVEGDGKGSPCGRMLTEAPPPGFR